MRRNTDRCPGLNTTEPKLSLLRTEKKRERIGNELKNVEEGGYILGNPFKQRVETFKKKITELPTASSTERQGLGDLGMDQVGKTTFKAGRTPTISQGVPVREAMMSGADMKQQAGTDATQIMANASPLTQRIAAILQGKPVAALQQVQQELQQLVPLLIQQQNPMKAKQGMKSGFQNMRVAYQQFGREPAQVGQAGTAAMAACKKV